MAVTALKDSQIPTIFSTGIYNEKKMDIAWDHTPSLLDVVVTGVVSCLANIKSKEHPVAYSFVQPNGEFVIAAMVQYFENESDKTKPGNWNLSWTFYQEDIPENAVVHTCNEIEFFTYFVCSGMNKYGMVFENTTDIPVIAIYLFDVIKKWLNDNASDVEERGIKLDGVIQFRVAVEDGEKVLSVEPDGEIKQLIKDDASIEV